MRVLFQEALAKSLRLDRTTVLSVAEKEGVYRFVDTGVIATRHKPTESRFCIAVLYRPFVPSDTEHGKLYPSK